MKFKPKTCRNCKEKFVPVRPLQADCSIKCAYTRAKAMHGKKERQKDKEKIKEMKAGLLTHSDYLNLLQKVFNTYIRKRDFGKQCISCGHKLGQKYDAGHYFSTGGYSALRFDEDNVHGQCVHCNQHLHGNLIMYGERLPERIGAKRFDDLNEQKHYTLKIPIPTIKEKIIIYKNKIKQLPLTNT